MTSGVATVGYRRLSHGVSSLRFEWPVTRESKEVKVYIAGYCASAIRNGQDLFKKSKLLGESIRHMESLKSTGKNARAELRRLEVELAETRAIIEKCPFAIIKGIVLNQSIFEERDSFRKNYVRQSLSMGAARLIRTFDSLEKTSILQQIGVDICDEQLIEEIDMQTLHPFAPKSLEIARKRASMSQPLSVEEMEKAGGQRWQKYGKDRIYFDPIKMLRVIGINKSIKDRDAKVYYDLNLKQFVVTCIPGVDEAKISLAVRQSIRSLVKTESV